MDRLRLLHQFVNMYGSRIIEATTRFEQTGTRAALVASLGDTGVIVSDMALNSLDVDALLLHYDPSKPGTRNTLAQLQQYKPATECVLGLAFGDGEILCFVLTVTPKK